MGARAEGARPWGPARLTHLDFVVLSLYWVAIGYLWQSLGPLLLGAAAPVHPDRHARGPGLPRRPRGERRVLAPRDLLYAAAAHVQHCAGAVPGAAPGRGARGPAGHRVRVLRGGEPARNPARVGRRGGDPRDRRAERRIPEHRGHARRHDAVHGARRAGPRPARPPPVPLGHGGAPDHVLLAVPPPQLRVAARLAAADPDGDRGDPELRLLLFQRRLLRGERLANGRRVERAARPRRRARPPRHVAPGAAVPPAGGAPTGGGGGGGPPG